MPTCAALTKAEKPCKNARGLVDCLCAKHRNVPPAPPKPVSIILAIHTWKSVEEIASLCERYPEKVDAHLIHSAINAGYLDVLIFLHKTLHFEITPDNLEFCKELIHEEGSENYAKVFEYLTAVLERHEELTTVAHPA